MRNERQLSHQEIKSGIEKRKPSPIILLLDSLTDPLNIGAMFRLADAANIEGIYGFQTKVYVASKKVDAVSRHTVKHIPFKELTSLSEVESLATSYCPIALEYTNQSIPFNQFKHAHPSMLIIGNEQRGVSEELLKLSQTSLHIPMLGHNSSMNVSVATGIVLYHLLQKLNLPS